MQLKLILVSRDGERRDYESAADDLVKSLKKKLQSEIFSEDIDHLRLLCGGRELEDGKLLRDALHGLKEPVILHVVAVKSAGRSASKSSTPSLCSQLCIIS